MKQTQHPIKVFLADDHQIVTTGVAAILSKQSNKELVGIAHSSEEIFNLLPKARPQVILLDLNMPGTDFYQNIQKLKKLYPWVKILVYTSYHSPELVKSLLKEGASGFILKTVHPDEIGTAIEAVFQGETYLSTVPYAHAKSDNGPVADSMLKDDFRKRLGLSRREQEVLALISKGLTSQLIGKTLFISKHTVETHRKNILRKLDIGSSAELVRFAVQQGLV